MPLQKNQILTLRIERLSSDGSGVAHSPDGETVFVPGAAPGDEADVRIVKDCKRYAFGILDHLRTPSPDRIPVDCAVAGPRGGRRPRARVARPPRSSSTLKRISTLSTRASRTSTPALPPCGSKKPTRGYGLETKP